MNENLVEIELLSTESPNIYIHDLLDDYNELENQDYNMISFTTARLVWENDIHGLGTSIMLYKDGIDDPNKGFSKAIAQVIFKFPENQKPQALKIFSTIMNSYAMDYLGWKETLSQKDNPDLNAEYEKRKSDFWTWGVNSKDIELLRNWEVHNTYKMGIFSELAETVCPTETRLNVFTRGEIKLAYHKGYTFYEKLLVSDLEEFNIKEVFKNGNWWPL